MVSIDSILPFLMPFLYIGIQLKLPDSKLAEEHLKIKPEPDNQEENHLNSNSEPAEEVYFF